MFNRLLALVRCRLHAYSPRLLFDGQVCKVWVVGGVLSPSTDRLYEYSLCEASSVFCQRMESTKSRGGSFDSGPARAFGRMLRANARLQSSTIRHRSVGGRRGCQPRHAMKGAPGNGLCRPSICAIRNHNSYGISQDKY